MDILSKNKNKEAEKEPGKAPDKKDYSLKLPQVTELKKISFEPRRAPKAVLVLALFVLLVASLVWGGMFLYGQSLDREVDGLNQQISDLEDRRDQQMASQIVGLERGLKSARDILENHIYASRSFDMLEELTLPNVQWTDFSLNVTSLKINLDGWCESYNAVAKQILIFENDNRISSVQISNVSLDQMGGVNVKMSLDLEKNFFKK